MKRHAAMIATRAGGLPLVAILAAAWPGPVRAEEPDARPRLAVLDFGVADPFKPSDGKVLAAFARDEIQQADKYDLMDREMMRERMTEKDFAATTECDEVRCLVRYGKSLDVHKIVGGFVSPFGKAWILNMRLVDVNTGREEATFAREHRGQMEDLIALTRLGTRQLLGLTPVPPEEPPPELVLDLGGGVTMELVLIPAGEFLMGSPESEKGHDSDEGPQHRVRITPGAPGFYMGRYEVTQAQWQAVMGNNPSHFKGDGNLPVETVSWNDCQEFCRKLSQRVGRRVRLPSEAEREYACRAGTTTPFTFGDTISTDQANYDGNYTYGPGRKGVYRQKTTPVGSFSPNAWGLYDMHGNVWEWCEDVWHDNYAGAPTDGGAWTSGGNQKARVLRGGSWYSSPRNCRSAYRHWSRPVSRPDNHGFRVAAGTR